MTDYSTLTDEQLNAEIVTRLGGDKSAYWVWDVNAALDLIPPNTYLTLAHPTSYYVVFEDYSQSGVVGFKAVVFSQNGYARAICECWLKWDDARHQEDK